MDRYVYYSKPKLIVSLAPLLGVAAAFVWLGLQGGGTWIFAFVWGLVVLVIIMKLSPFNAPVLEVGPIEVAYGPSLSQKVPISMIKYATGGAAPHAWPGALSIQLEMESRVAAGQRYFGQETIRLFCIDTPIAEVAARINFFVQTAQLNDG